MEGEEEQKKENEDKVPEVGESPPDEAEPPPLEAEPPPPEETKPPPEETKPPPEETKPPPEEPKPPPEEPEPPPKGPKSVTEVTDKPSAVTETVKEPSTQGVPSTLSQRTGKSASIVRTSDQRSRVSEKSVVINQSVDKPSSKLEQARRGLASAATLTTGGNFNCAAFFQKRSPFSHNPPQLEERRERIENPRTPREYIINLRENLADFQESHGLPRTRDYSFMSLGMALAQETARALCSLFLMFAELFPIVAIVSLIVRFALDKLIEILETDEPVPKAKKSILFALQMLVIIIPLWILIGTIIIPFITLMFSIVRRMFRFKGSKCPSSKTGKSTCSAFDYLRFFY